MKTKLHIIFALILIFSMTSCKEGDSPLNDPDPTPEESPQDFVKVGVIRWDAWVGDKWSAGLEVERILSGIPLTDPSAPAIPDYHFRVPWFGSIQPDNKVLARYTDMLTLEREIRYAKAAGIDYWVTVWYGNQNDTGGSLQRNLWVKSLQRNSLQWCHLFDGNFRGAVGNGTTTNQKKIISDIVAIDFKSDMYLKTKSGRPVFYILWADNTYAACINALYAECAAQGVPEPFVVITTDQGNATAINSVIADCRASGISAYVVFGSKDVAYSSFSPTERNRWALWNSCNGVAIPTVTSGWDNRPRYYSGCSWYENIEILRDAWIQYPTAAELQKQTEDAIRFTQENPKAEDFKSILIYAWNEYDEGGYIAPTLFQLQDEANNHRPVKLDAVNKAIQTARVSYTDIGSHAAVGDIRQLASSYVFSGVPNDKFSPDEIVNVNEYTAWLVRTFGLYADVNVSTETKFLREIAIARILGILQGQESNRQGAPLPITDQEVVTLTANVMKLLNMSDSDADAQGIFNSISESRMTRAKAATMLVRCLELPFKRQ
jgi:hypothetical protein